MRMLSLKSDLYTSPWNFERPSVNNWRMIVTHSRIAVIGLRYDAPCHRSTMIGLDTPRPAIARPPDSSLIVRNPIAIAPGVRI